MNNNLCWICQQPATTSEHNPKRSDLKLMFRDATFEKGNRLVKTTAAGEKILVQGLNSKEVKYEKNLCDGCNNSGTQPYDKAYETLIDFIVKNHVAISKQKIVNLKIVYGKEVRRCQSDLFKYFAKTVGCTINATGNKVPSSLLDVIQGKSYGKNFFVTISINEELLKIKAELKGLAGCSDLHLLKEKRTGEEVWIWSQNLGWLVLTYWFNAKIMDDAIPWYGKSKVIKFSQFYFSEETTGYEGLNSKA